MLGARLRAIAHILLNIRKLSSLTFGMLAELSYLQFTALVGGRYPDVRPYGHSRNSSREAAGLPYPKQQVPTLWSEAEAESSKSVHDGSQIPKSRPDSTSPFSFRYRSWFEWSKI